MPSPMFALDEACHLHDPFDQQVPRPGKEECTDEGRPETLSQYHACYPRNQKERHGYKMDCELSGFHALTANLAVMGWPASA